MVGSSARERQSAHSRYPRMSSFRALLTERKINTKVSLGFGCVLVILASVSGLAYLAFESAAAGFAFYTRQVAAVDSVRDIDRTFLNMRRFVREYAFTGVETNLDAAKQEETALRAMLGRAAGQIKDPERQRRVQDIARLTDLYLAEVGKLVVGTHAFATVQQSTLTPLGLAQRGHFAALIAAGGGDGGLATLAAKGLDQWMLMRLNAIKAMLQHDSTAVADVETTYAGLVATLNALDAAATDPASHAHIDALRRGVPAYLTAFHQAMALIDIMASMVNGTMPAMGQQVQDHTEAIKASGIADEKQMEQETFATMDGTGALVLELSIGGLLAGALLAWLIGRGIAAPIVRLGQTMSALAGGDKTVAVPGLERRDEIGAMAKAVDVFKRHALDIDRLHAEQERQKLAAQTERRGALRQLADGFESQVGGVIQSVGTATSQLQSAANHMRDNAARTSTEATSVASASAASAANAQAVASASEQLTSSINEIAKQVENARVIAGQADEEATRTTDLMRKLSETVNAIGAIVALINDVASQTNLLALNATIEAARAGDAGRGFAVVASEVKNLANQTAKATEDIASKIGAVQSGTADAAKAIVSITEIMARMSAISAAIAAAVEQQSSATAEIARNVENAASGTQEVSDRIANVDLAARQTGETATEINSSATELSNQARTLRDEVNRFLGQVRSDQGTVRMLVWDDAWSVGVPAIDRHHRELVDGLNSLFAAMLNGEGREVAPRVARLIADTIEPHFAGEEELMRRHRDPGLEAHRQSHKTFVSRFQDVSRTLRANEAFDAGPFFDFVSGWFRQHMSEFDGPMARLSHGKQAA
jgi:hemerythrin-like metal-binding protein